MYPSGRSAVLHKNKLVKDLEPLLGEEFLSNFVSTTLDVKTQGAGYLAELPQSICYTTVMYTNKALLDSLGLSIPTTYEDLKSMVPMLKAHGIQTVLMANKDDWVMQSCLFSTIAGRYVGSKWFEEVNEGKVKFTDSEFVAALRMLETIYNDDVISRNTIQIAYGEAPGLFASGKAAFFVDGDWKQSAFLTNPSTGEALISPERQENEIELIQFPSLPEESYPSVVSATLGCGFGISSAIEEGSEQEKAAVKLIKYLYSTEVQQQYLDIGRYVPSRKDISADNVEPIIKKMMKYYSQSDSTCYVLDSVLDPIVYTVLNKVLQEIGMGTKTPEAAALEVQNAMDSYIQMQ
jgi:raffinose/stachyose/melibiose transport system substrate-binding protein